MKYTAAHWGAYQFDAQQTHLSPLHGDTYPSLIGTGWVSASQNRSARILTPMVRKGWLAGDKGRNRCNDSFVEISWDRAIELAATALQHVTSSFGNEAVFGGSYGWSSAGRFHHAQSQMRRCLAAAGGFTTSRETYSHAAAEVLFPYILGISNSAFQAQMTSTSLVTEHAEIVLAFGGISGRTAQISSAGTTRHEIPSWIKALQAAGVRVITVSPEKGEAPEEWWAIRPGTDTALIIALIHEIVAAGKEDHNFLERYTSGWDTLRAYVMGDADHVPKNATWAAGICDIKAEKIKALARDLVASRSMISLAWSLQRAEYGEQPIWAGLALACVLGQIGQPGTGFGFGYGSVAAVGRPVTAYPWPSLPKLPNQVSSVIPVARIADALLAPGAPYLYQGKTHHYPDLKLIWWTGGNPFHHHQDLRRLEKAWSKPETVIVNDHSWTATARRADIVLPATTPLERDDLMINKSDPTLLYMSAFHAPLGQARNDFDIFRDIAERLGVADQFTQGRDTDGWLRHLWHQCEAVASAHNIVLPQFDAFKSIGRFDLPDAAHHQIAFESFIKDPLAAPLPSESGKFTLTNDAIGAMSLPDCPSHPTWLPPTEQITPEQPEFYLISGQPRTRLHSQNDQGSASCDSKVMEREVCTLHPDAAAKIGVTDGAIIRLWNARGACLAAVRLSPDIRPDCISLPTGAWYDPQTVDGAYLEVHGNPNALTRDAGCSSLSQGNMAHSCVVKAEVWTKPLPPLTVTQAPPHSQA